VVRQRWIGALLGNLAAQVREYRSRDTTCAAATDAPGLGGSGARACGRDADLRYMRLIAAEVG